MDNKKYYTILAALLIVLGTKIVASCYFGSNKVQNGATVQDTATVDTTSYEFYDVLPSGDTIFYGEDEWGI